MDEQFEFESHEIDKIIYKKINRQVIPKDKTIPKDYLYHIHQYKVWSEDLLGENFYKMLDYVLTRTERMVTELLVEGYSDEQICVLMKFKFGTLENHKANIKEKLRNNMKVRVDDWKF